jgi:hypothetical protein
MAKRFFATELWEEDWFIEMPNEYKLFWYYMLANCDHAGLYKVNLRSFSGLLEVKVSSAIALTHFNFGKQRIRVITDSVWFIEDFFVFQYGTTFNINNKLHESISKLLAKHKIPLTSLRGLQDLKDTLKDKDKEIKKESMRENKVLGKEFSVDKKSVFFEDGTQQELGQRQLQRMKDSNYQPHYIKKGEIE